MNEPKEFGLTIEFIEDNTGELTRQSLDEGYQAVEVALGPDGVRALVEERNTAQGRVKELEKYIGELPFCETCGGAGGLAAYRIDSLQIMVHRYADEVKELQAQLEKAQGLRKDVNDAFQTLRAAGLMVGVRPVTMSNLVAKLVAERDRLCGQVGDAVGELVKTNELYSQCLNGNQALRQKAETAEARAATLLPVTEASLKYFEALEKGASLGDQQRLWLLWDCAVIKYRAALTPKENK